MKGSYDAEGISRFLMKATEKESYASPQPHQDVFLSVLLFLMKTLYILSALYSNQ